MTRRNSVLIVLLAGLPLLAMGQSVQQIVEQHFPQSLITPQLQNDPNDSPTRYMSYVELDLEGNGVKEVVAAYGNGTFVQLRVLGLDGRLIQDPVLPRIGALEMKLDKLNLGAGDLPVVRLTTSAMQGRTNDWIFGWRNGTLVPINPIEKPAYPELPAISKLYATSAMDIDGDGLKELLSVEIDRNGVRFDKVYDLKNGVLNQRGTISSLEFFSLRSGKPKLQPGGFDVVDDSVRYNIHLLNGDDRGKSSQVTSATVSLNGNPLFTPEDFNNHARLLTKSTRLAKHNTLTVRLKGKSGSGITIYAVPITQ